MFFFLSKPTGPAADLLYSIQRGGTLKHWRVSTRKRGKPLKRLVLGIGQVHPVLHGRFAWFQARGIANVQAEIFELCRLLAHKKDVRSFGQEGFSSSRSDAKTMQARLNPLLLEELEETLRHHTRAKLLLRRIAQDWRKALKRGKQKKAAEAATALNALTLLQSLDSRISIFPIEQKDVHGQVHAGIMQLRKEVKKVESSAVYRAVRTKGGKGLTKEEYEAAKHRNKLVEEFNAMLAHPERDRSILREVLKHAQNKPLTVFVLGEGHRSGFLTLAAKHLPEDVLFAWVTPPGLWWWKVMLRRVGWGVAIGTIILVLLSV